MKFRRFISRRQARGFTLLEMMLVVMIMGVLIGVAAWNIIGQGDKARRAATRASMATVDSMLKTYNLDNGTYPARLDALIPKYTEKLPTDSWKRPLVYFANPPGSPHPYTLYSTGGSGEQGGADNIDYWTPDEVAPAN